MRIFCLLPYWEEIDQAVSEVLANCFQGFLLTLNLWIEARLPPLFWPLCQCLPPRNTQMSGLVVIMLTTSATTCSMLINATYLGENYKRQIMHLVIQSYMPISWKKLKQDRISGNVSLQFSSPGGNSIIHLFFLSVGSASAEFNQPGIENL